MPQRPTTPCHHATFPREIREANGFGFANGFGVAYLGWFRHFRGPSQRVEAQKSCRARFFLSEARPGDGGGSRLFELAPGLARRTRDETRLLTYSRDPAASRRASASVRQLRHQTALLSRHFVTCQVSSTISAPLTKPWP